MNTIHKLNRGQIALVLLARIFEMNDDELADAFQSATGHLLTDPSSDPATGDIWNCDRDFASLCDPDKHRLLDYLRSQLPPA